MTKRALFGISVWALVSAAGQSRADIVLRAATAGTGAKTEVRLRWVVTSGWIPDGGFNLYRTQNGMRGPAIHIGAKPMPAGQDLSATVTAAKATPTGVQDKDIILVRPPASKPVVGSKDAFLKLKTQRVTLFQPL